MTPTGKQLYHSLEFWDKRYDEQLSYIANLPDRDLSPDRYDELFNSACEVFSIICKRLGELDDLKYGGAQR